MVKDEFKIEKTLRLGQFGVTLLARRVADRRLVVLKEISTGTIKSDKDRRKKLENEMNTLLELSAPELVEILDFTRAVPLKKSWFSVVEHCSGGTLRQKLTEVRSSGRRFTEVKILDWFLNIISAVNYLHSKKIVHGAICCQNILFENSNCSFAKLGDYGSAKIRDICKLPADSGGEDLLTLWCYRAPETFDSPPDFKSDIWSLGVLLFELANLHLPYHAKSRPEMLQKMAKPPEKPIAKHFSLGYRCLVGRMLANRPSTRPCAADVLTDDLVADRVLEQMGETVHLLENGAAFESPGNKKLADDLVPSPPAEYCTFLDNTSTPTRKRSLSSISGKVALSTTSNNQ